jgi:hypothetical protein
MEAPVMSSDTDSGETAAPKASLMGIPSEIRAGILHILFENARTDITTRKLKSRNCHIALLRTCKLLNAEGQKALSSNLLLCIDSDVNLPHPLCSKVSHVFPNLRYLHISCSRYACVPDLRLFPQLKVLRFIN